MCSRQICSNCVMLSCQNGPKSLRDVSNTLQKEVQRFTSKLDYLLFSGSPASRSAFSVALNNDSALTCFGPFATNRVVVYKHVFLNLGGGYNVSTGVFTVPRSGVYSFALTVYGRAPNSSTLAACANLRVNGTVVTGPTENGMHDREDSATIVVAVKLKAGDKVDVVLPAGCFLCDNSSHFNTFTGFLLYLLPYFEKI
uniref:Cerebellin 20 n=1 Tax=Amphiprion percula TaxID=161767 RepID=A0A3P8UBL5_AMPPE